MNSSYDRLASLTIATTVVVMFIGVVIVAPKLQSANAASIITAGAASALVSVGIYRLIAALFLWLFKKCRAIRRFALGAGYLEGTWVGHYKDSESKLRFTIEFIDQSSGETKIHGREIDQTGATRGSWKSDSVSVDPQNQRIIYNYSCGMHENRADQRGIAVFDLITQEDGGYPSILDGYAADLIDGQKDPNKEYKISETAVKDEFALIEAHRIFKIAHSAFLANHQAE
jgi:hypothetical protein